jgi:hypothetical protein
MKEEMGGKEQSNAVVRLLIGEPSQADLAWLRSPDGHDFANMARKNVISIRTYERLKEFGIEANAEFTDIVQSEKDRIGRTMELIKILDGICRREGIGRLFLKSFQHFPDMGNDIDLLVMDYSDRFDKVVEKEAGFRPMPGNIMNFISGKSDIMCESYPSPIEVHHGRIGHLGEHLHYPRELMSNCMYFEVDGIPIPIPSSEDQLLIHTLQRMYYHFYIRISDLIGSIKLVKTEGLNWDRIIGTSDKINIRNGLSAYLSYLDEAHLRAFGSTVVPKDVSRILNVGRYRGLTFTKGYYKYPLISVASRVYISKITKGAITGDLAGAFRSALMPVFGMVYLAKNLGKVKSRYFN